MITKVFISLTLFKWLTISGMPNDSEFKWAKWHPRFTFAGLVHCESKAFFVFYKSAQDSKIWAPFCVNPI